MRCHYLTDGSVNFAFAIRRAEFFIPVGVLLKCFAEVSECELFGYLTASAPQDAGAASVLHPDVRLWMDESLLMPGVTHQTPVLMQASAV